MKNILGRMPSGAHFVSSSVFEHSPVSFSQLLGQAFDNGIVEACFVRTRTYGVYFIRELPGHRFEPFN